MTHDYTYLDSAIRIALKRGRPPAYDHDAHRFAEPIAKERGLCVYRVIDERLQALREARKQRRRVMERDASGRRVAA